MKQIWRFIGIGHDPGIVWTYTAHCPIFFPGFGESLTIKDKGMAKTISISQGYTISDSNSIIRTISPSIIVGTSAVGVNSNRGSLGKKWNLQD